MKNSILLILISVISSVAAAEVRYVTDDLNLAVRAGTSTRHKIVKMLPSGTQVEVLKTADGYSKIRTPRGIEGWMLTRHLMERPSARNRVKTAEQQATGLRVENQRLSSELQSLGASSSANAEHNVTLAAREGELEQQLNAIRRTSAGALKLAEQNRTFKRELIQKDKELQSLNQEIVTLRERTDQQWFLIGAIVVLVSIFLGHLLPRMRLRRGSNLDNF